MATVVVRSEMVTVALLVECYKREEEWSCWWTVLNDKEQEEEDEGGDDGGGHESKYMVLEEIAPTNVYVICVEIFDIFTYCPLLK